MGGKRREMFTHEISGAYVLFMTANPHRCHSIQTKTEEDRYDLGEDRTERKDLAGSKKAKVKQLAQKWEKTVDGFERDLKK